jgi:hypothetical protein
MKIRFPRAGFLIVASSLIGMILLVTQWSCKQSSNVVGTTVPTTATVSGTVVSKLSGTPIEGAWVTLSYPGSVDSVKTGSDGTFSFVVEIADTSGISITLTVNSVGYIKYSRTISIVGSQNFPISLSVDPSTYAIVNGIVQDSVSQWPLPGATVIVSLSSSSSSMKYMSYFKSNVKSVESYVITSATTDTTGSFTLYIPFPDYLSSVSLNMAVSKTGFIPYQTTKTFVKGRTESDIIRLQQDNAQSVAHIVGQVVDSKSRMPITNVSVILTSSLKIDSIKTSSSGNYSFDLDLPGATNSLSGTLLFRLDSYNDTTISFSVNAGSTLTENVALTAKPTVVGGDSNTGRGIARSISEVSVSSQEISIHGVGRNETSVLVWQVLDSLGYPVDINHRYTVTFIPTGDPVTLGGAYVTPTSGMTDGSGEVSTTVNSGTVAGTIQLIAQLALSNGTVIKSSPVQITVDGGLPDQAHFGLNPKTINFAGYDWSGVTQSFTVQAGDKYGNPVAPGTAIYFSSTTGIITAAGQTDATGHASATLYSGNPLPKVSGLDPTQFGDGTGYAYVKASTQGENSVTVADSVLICVSASTGPILFNGSVSIPQVIIHDSIGSVSIPVHISDRFGNPLEPGTTITVSTDYTPPSDVSGVTWKVSANGLPSTLDDFLTRGPGSTDFTLVVTASASPANVLATSPLPFTVTVTVSGRNGTRSNTFSGMLVQ